MGHTHLLPELSLVAPICGVARDLIVAAKDDFLVDQMVETGLLTMEQVDGARSDADAAGEGLIDTLVRSGQLDVSMVTMAKANYFGVESVQVSDLKLSDEVLKSIPRHIAKKYSAVPVAVNEGSVVVAVADPSDIEAIDGLQVALGKTVELRVASPQDIEDALGRYYGGGGGRGGEDSEISMMIQNLTEGEVEVTTPKGGADADGKGVDADAPIIRLVNQIIVDAYKLKASDIHLEPLAKRFRLRYRIDGICVEMKDLPKRLQAPIIARLKIQSGMSIAERRIPQDGRIQTNVGGKTIDVPLRFRGSLDPAEAFEISAGELMGNGYERLLRYDVNDLRLYFENDLRFLSQF